VDSDPEALAAAGLAEVCNSADASNVLMSAVADSLAGEQTQESILEVSGAIESIIGMSTGTQVSSDGAQVNTVPIEEANYASDLILSTAQAASQVEGGLSTEGATSLLTSVSALLPSVDATTAASSSESSSTSDQQDAAAAEAQLEAQKQLSDTLVQAVSVEIPKAVASSLEVGEETTVESGDGLVLQMKKEAPETMAESGTTVGSWSIPGLGGILTSARRLDSSCDGGAAVSNTQWPRNPYAYAGSTTSDNSTSSGMNVSEAVQSTELFVCGEVLVVEDLPEFINFTLDSPKYSGKKEEEQKYDPSLEFEFLTVTEEDQRSCKYWDTKAGAWSSKGCWITAIDNVTINCSCSHLSSFSSAAGKSFGKLGNNNAALLAEPLKIDFSHGPFVVVFCWMIVILLPYLLCCWKDRDYPWLNQRALFKDKLPKQDNDFRMMCMPAFRICSGLMACGPFFVNCSKIKRWLKCFFCCDPRDLEEHHRKLVESKKAPTSRNQA
jgi:hypothetical protein